MSHYLYLVRHGEQENAEHGINDGPLSERGRAQAHLIGRRLAAVPLSETYTSPLDRAVQTSAVIDQYTSGPAALESTLLFDCIPTGQDGAPSIYDGFFGGIGDEVIEAGVAQMSDAYDTFFSKSRDDRHTLLVTHNFVIGEFVRRVVDAPEWRWLGLNSVNTGLTVVRVRTRKPAELLLFNDQSHLTPELRTGVSASIAI
ncbi:histidine phosphatase family protein [Pseudoclavibacter sp. RFBA6]|uniref:histidine phosphatase family protein n=1 Tax=Pseudoclavibacter sp. RFBA6 TaxID=2080573 RepID=UPI000CE7914E|nr:histidine phosphatase family protein [Pseudoclavibacter sp. RFBA6]PPG39348.1 histidine phosphatase family protein [Pseudoclavibacter sp. RFBA6]